MRLKFEQWILSQGASQTAEDLFREAVICYKASAYRAALLLSYLGFQTIIKDRILASQRPNGIRENHWRSITDKLTDDSTWDGQAFDATQMKDPAPIFVLSDDLRRQVVYWKDRRNDCAHSRRNEIGLAHIEAFWLFLTSNLPKFVVSGSKEGLLREIKEHFDQSLTPAGTDSSYIVRQIPYAIEPESLEEFFGDVDRIFVELHRRPVNAPIYPTDEVRFFDSIADLDDMIVTNKLVEFLKSQEDLLVGVLKFNPARVQLITDDPQLIRKLWYEKLLPMTKMNFEIYCSILRNQLIPDDQVEEAHRRVILSLSNAEPPEDCYVILRDSNFFSLFRSIVFLPPDLMVDRFNWANGNYNFVIWYLDRIGVDEQIARCLSQVFGRENHPYDLRDALNAFLSQNERKREEFRRIFDENQIPYPTHLQLDEPTVP